MLPYILQRRGEDAAVVHTIQIPASGGSYGLVCVCVCVCYINVQLLVCLLSWACGWRRVGVAYFPPWSQQNKIIQIFAQSQPDREKGEEREKE